MREEIKMRIVVMTGGWVYVGVVQDHHGEIVMEHARCIRRWGTTGGLAQLAKEGPMKDTALDPTARLTAYKASIIYMLDCEASKW